MFKKNGRNGNGGGKTVTGKQTVFFYLTNIHLSKEQDRAIDNFLNEMGVSTKRIICGISMECLNEIRGCKNPLVVKVADNCTMHPMPEAELSRLLNR